MAFDIKQVKAAVNAYSDEVRLIRPVIKVFLYGSYA
jgi:hypothetical protein